VASAQTPAVEREAQFAIQVRSHLNKVGKHSEGSNVSDYDGPHYDNP